jgi:hypothetical protein
VIVAVPFVTPVTMPEPSVTVATDVLLLLHVPPPVPSLSVVVAPAHTVVIPVIPTGGACTATATVARQPVGRVYVINTLPVDSPVTIPVEEPTIAISVLPLLQVPPTERSLSDVVVPVQILVAPVIKPGSGLTVTVIVVKQPEPIVYVIVSTPADTPLTTPVLKPTEATDRLPLVQWPPEAVSLSAVVEPTHTDLIPVIPEGLAYTVTGIVVSQPVGSV